MAGALQNCDLVEAHRRTLSTGAVVIVLVVALLQGCAVSRALSQPAKKDYRVLKPGTNMDLVRAELDAPMKSGRVDCDVFIFEKGSSPGGTCAPLAIRFWTSRRSGYARSSPTLSRPRSEGRGYGYGFVTTLTRTSPILSSSRLANRP